MALWLGTVHGGSVERVEVWHDANRYGVRLNARVEASAERVYALMTDYERLGRINSAIKIAEIVAWPRPGVKRLRTLIELCVWFFCADLAQVQDMERRDDELIATVVPDRGSFRSGWARWRFSADGAHTELTMDSELEPSFAIPPVVGPWLLQYMMRREAIATIEGIERAARDGRSR